MPSMQAAFTALDGWLLRTTLGGGIVLLVGALWMLISRQPVKRQRIGELALLCALLVALPAALPAWWSLPGSTKTDALLSQPGVASRDPAETTKDPTEQSYDEEFDTQEGFEILELLGILDERHEPVPVQAVLPDELVQQPTKDDHEKTAGAGLLSRSHSPWV